MDQKKDIIEPVTIDVGLSPDVAGVVSILTCADGRVVIHGLPPKAALAYFSEGLKLAQQVLAGTVRIPCVEQTIGASLTVERQPSGKLDS